MPVSAHACLTSTAPMIAHCCHKPPRPHFQTGRCPHDNTLLPWRGCTTTKNGTSIPARRGGTWKTDRACGEVAIAAHLRCADLGDALAVADAVDGALEELHHVACEGARLVAKDVFDLTGGRGSARAVRGEGGGEGGGHRP